MLRKATVLIALLATTIAVAACGGSSPTNNAAANNAGSSDNAGSASSATASTRATASRKNAGLRLAHCMRSHGVPDFPDPSSGGGFAIQGSANGSQATVSVDGHTLNISGPAFQRAMQECRSVLPQGPPISGSQLAKIKQGALKMAACMRSHGVAKFPDPQVTTGPGGHGIGIRIGGPPSANGGPGVINPRSPAFQKAQQACSHFMGGFGPKGKVAAP